ncbi:CpXC domain-containing protein [Evansella halocellulosilytica]|uniref:CpXC domain-containing protein n=1 Tax=Evansella halocellulosilytica TaxID=2011013 RepID=UPI000BB70AE0|nr:CpXC domain-containing protein [Evansella halocellulosilytica]
MVLKFLRKKKLMNTTHISCPSCEEETDIEMWNSIAKEVYGVQSPDVREAASNKGNSFPYQCPKCHTGFSAHKLTFIDKEEKEDLIKVKHQEEF